LRLHDGTTQQPFASHDILLKQLGDQLRHIVGIDLIDQTVDALPQRFPSDSLEHFRTAPSFLQFLFRERERERERERPLVISEVLGFSKLMRGDVHSSCATNRCERGRKERRVSTLRGTTQRHRERQRERGRERKLNHARLLDMVEIAK